MDDCIYCRIIKKEMPSYVVYEDDMFIAILDIFPKSKGHTLIIPKKHYRWVYDVPEFDAYWLVALKITKAQQKALSPEYISYVTYGTQVPHAHIHVIPRYSRTEDIPASQKGDQAELSAVAKVIQKAVRGLV